MAWAGAGTGGVRGGEPGPRAGAEPGRWARRWPLIGREDLLARLAEARRAPGRPAVMLGGPQGVGKSRLAEEALDQAREERWATDRIDGAAATAAVPLGAVAHLAPPAAVRSGDSLRVLLAVVEQLRARAARRSLMVVVDDAHELDEASLAALRRALTIPNLFLLMTVRSDDPLPPPLVTLWKDGLVERIDVPPLSRDETYRLVADVVGGTPSVGAEAGGDPTGEVETATLRWLWDHSLGNPLFLRELVLAEGPGDWRCVDGVWARATDRPLGRRLAEVVRSRLDHLDEPQRAVLEVLTVGGPLRLDQLGQLVSLDAVAQVTDKGLVTARPGRSGVVVALAHPLYGKVLSDGFTTVRSQSLRGRLLDVLAPAGEGAGPGSSSDTTVVAADPADVGRVAALQLDLGLEVDSKLLVLAADLVLAAYPRTLAERLARRDASPGPGSAGTAATTGLPDADLGAAVGLVEATARPGGETGDAVRLAGRLAQGAWERDRSLPTGLAWVAVLVATGRAEEAEAVTAELDALVRTEWDRTWVAVARSGLQFWVQADHRAAVATLRAAESAVTDPAAVRRLQGVRAGVALNVGRVEDAARLADELVAGGEPDDPTGLMAAATSAAAHALAGRPRRGAEVADRAVPAAATQVAEAPEVLGQLMLARHFAARMLGAVDDAEWIAYACHQAGVEHGSLDAVGVFTGALGHIALDRGQAATAARRLRESEVLLRERDMFGYRPWVLACLAATLGQLGQADAARATYDLVRASAPVPPPVAGVDASDPGTGSDDALLRDRFFTPDLVLAEAWCLAAAGKLRDAADRARAAAERARAAGLASFEATARHALVRLGRSDAATAARLATLAEAADSPLWRAFAAHAEASAAGDPVGLSAVSTTFEELGFLLLAAEAAAEAAALHVRREEQAAAFRASSRAGALADRCEGARPPALRLHVGAPTLTAREREVAALVADGLTSRAIAEHLVLSPRTVE
ncbi:MAG TPA: AAA family ATPase, partial [Acidimicrobiales bacterium]